MTRPLPEALREWSETPSPNPRYKGATPADMVRALRGERPPRPASRPEPETRPVRTTL